MLQRKSNHTAVEAHRGTWGQYLAPANEATRRTTELSEVLCPPIVSKVKGGGASVTKLCEGTQNQHHGMQHST